MSLAKHGATLLAALTLTLSTTLPAAAGPPRCAPAANVFGVESDGRLFVYPHNEPETGGADWGAKRYIGTGWNGGLVLAGPGGVFYLVDRTSGDLRRYQWTGGGWSTFAGGGQFQTVSTGWGYYTQPGNTGKVTVDSAGKVYSITAAGNLEVREWTTLPPSGAQSAAAPPPTWARFDRIVAAGDGVVYARESSSGKLFRFRYDFATGTWLEFDKLVGAGWGVFGTVFSVGGDTLYGVRPNGALVAYHYDAAAGAWSNRGTGQVIGWGWSALAHVSGDPAACTPTSR
ncbi:tachylectin-related carbohydrate-binding protein [Actinokineospora diospyrosa]|uniref:Tachylectin n=1 Tax=Actinokineospora diospyrosa TaxID=103728 RepID=A0ABT1IGC1_9PSEU|nr:tachylectin-related carbohydrate-binding protein [Actinokineospora diospyrosa]MCP2271664.1 Tachylectin [Actinokineospora diospyrosa]